MSGVLGLGMTLNLMSLVLVLTRLLLFILLHGSEFLGLRESGRLQRRGLCVGEVPIWRLTAMCVLGLFDAASFSRLALLSSVRLWPYVVVSHAGEGVTTQPLDGVGCAPSGSVLGGFWGRSPLSSSVHSLATIL